MIMVEEKRFINGGSPNEGFWTRGHCAPRNRAQTRWVWGGNCRRDDEKMFVGGGCNTLNILEMTYIFMLLFQRKKKRTLEAAIWQQGRRRK